MDQFKDGDSEVINGVTYVRQGGQWHPQSSSGPVYGLAKTPNAQTPAQATQDTLQVDKLKGDLEGIPVQHAIQREQLHGQELTNQQKALQLQQQQQQNQNMGTGEQQTAAGFYGRALFANQKYGNGVPPRGFVGQELADHLPTGLVNQFTSPERQQADTFARDFIAATLRKESGAAISDQEYQMQYQRYFPQPGDSPQVIADKAQLRQTALLSLKNMAGPASSKAEQSIQQMLGAPTVSGGQQAPSQLSPAQQSQEQAFLATNPTPEQYAHFAAALQGNPNAPIDIQAATARLNALKSGAAYNPAIQEDPRAKALAQQYMQQGGGAGAAFVAGASDTAGLGLSDEFGAGLKAVGQSLSGNGSFADNYNVDLQANRDYQGQLQGSHAPSYIGGQIVGGALLPAGEVSAPADLAKVGAAYGAAYGAGSGTDAQSRITGGVTGAAAGGALGYAVPKGVAMLNGRAPAEVPPLVDPQTGQLNQPLEAMSPGQRVVKAEEYGVNLPADAAGGRTAAVIGKGLDIMPGSAGVMEDARRGTESQIAAASDVVASRYGNARTMNEAGAELQRGANDRIERGKEVIGKAYSAIPIADNAKATTNSTVSTLQELTGRFQSNPDLAETLKDPKLARYQEAIQSGGLSWKDMKDFRSLIGEKIGDMRFGEGHSTSDLRKLYAGLSEDMRNTAANAGPGALKAFERANNLNRQNEELIQGSLTRILGKDGSLAPEKAAAAVQAMTKGGKSTGDLRTLAQIKSATVKSGAWNEIASTLIRLGGQPANSAGRDFNPQTFVQWYADMAEPARNMLFGGSNNDLRKALDGFVAVNQRLQKVNALRNTSNTAGSMTAAGTVGTMAASLSNPLLGAKLMGVMAGNYGMAKAWTNPSVVRWMTGYSKAVASGSEQAVKSQIGRITALAATNPELREPLVALQQRLVRAANDNATRPAAASQSNTQEDQQGK